MNDINRKSQQEILDKYWGKWDFINPRWILFLGVIFGLVQMGLYNLTGSSDLRITDSIFIKRATTGIGDIAAIDIIFALIHVALIVGILYVSICVLPNEKRHDHLRLTGIFVIVGSFFKVIMTFVGTSMALTLEIGESFKMPMITCADLYIFGGFIAMIVLIAKNYSNQDMEEIILAWKTARANKKNKG